MKFDIQKLRYPFIALCVAVVRMAKENSDWGYDRIVGAMANLGYRLSDQTVGNILQRHGIPPAPERQRTTTWTVSSVHICLSLRGLTFPR